MEYGVSISARCVSIIRRVRLMIWSDSSPRGWRCCEGDLVSRPRFYMRMLWLRGMNICVNSSCVLVPCVLVFKYILAAYICIYLGRVPEFPIVLLM